MTNNNVSTVATERNKIVNEQHITSVIYHRWNKNIILMSSTHISFQELQSLSEFSSIVETKHIFLNAMYNNRKYYIILLGVYSVRAKQNKSKKTVWHFQNKTAASVAWPGPVGPSPDSDDTAPGGSILIHLPADPHKKWSKKNKASVMIIIYTPDT